MSETSEGGGRYPRTAACACGALTVTVLEAPFQVHICSCLECQKISGGAFSYSAFFHASAVASIDGEYRTWRRQGGSGQSVEKAFCPTCGTTLFIRLGVWPGVTGVAVGAFGDPAFAKPVKHYWSSRRHHWLAVPADVEAVETQ